MCTVSWLPAPDGYVLCCNRDERRTRAAALPPTARVQHGVRYLAPLDGEQGGTWLAVNEFGLALSLLNLYCVEGYAPPESPRSRGLLLLDLIGSASANDARAALDNTALQRTQPFTLVIAPPEGPALLARWDGHSLSYSSAAGPGLLATSSAMHESDVVTARRATFAALDPVTDEALTALHRSHLPERGGRSICMHRPDAETRSFSRVVVTPGWVTLQHTADAPCRESPMTALDLPRLIVVAEPLS